MIMQLREFFQFRQSIIISFPGCASALVARQYRICITNVASLILPDLRSSNAGCKRRSISLYVAVHPPPTAQSLFCCVEKLVLRHERRVHIDRTVLSFLWMQQHIRCCFPNIL